MKFEIYYSRAGFGLSKDAKILSEALTSLGHSPSVSELPKAGEGFGGKFNEKLQSVFVLLGVLFFYRRLQRLIFGKPTVVAVHLEKIFYWKLFLHRHQILIPNQEWFNPKQYSLLSFIDGVWAKTSFAATIFSEFKTNVEKIGFSSSVEPTCIQKKGRDYFFSRVGMSRFRGAEVLVSLWRRHPEWPVLKLVIDKSCRPLNPPINVEYLDIFLNYEDYVACSNTALFHIYATETEGFGHSIVEAMGSGAVVLVTDAPPMNEIANSTCALMIGASYVGQKWFSPRFSVDPAALEAAVNKALKMNSEEIQKIVDNAMLRPNSLKQDFYSSLATAINKL
ncbi:glycosyltransferase [Cellvibrio fontiphilus]|uniref:Glycosyltransferase n=1 Tax=Cellvibrio fontiphilus TaxID=1815559 RepID=A0ABV7FFW2_9GAMM